MNSDDDDELWYWSCSRQEDFPGARSGMSRGVTAQAGAGMGEKHNPGLCFVSISVLAED